MSNVFSLDELNALTNTYVLGQPTDIFFRSNVLLYMLMESKRKVNGGKKIDVPLEHGEANTGAYGNTTTISTVKTETHNKAEFDWGGYHASQTIDLDDQVQNNGDAALVNLVAAKFKNMEKSLKRKMGVGIYKLDVIDGVLGFTGLNALFGTDTSVAYGNIKEDDVSIWKANVNSDAITANFAGFQTIRSPAIVDTNDEGKPNLYMTTQDIVDAFTNSLQAQVRYKDTKLADAGFSNIQFDGAPVVADLNQTAKRVDALNTRHMEFISHSKYDFTTPKWEADRTQPDILTANIRWIGQLGCNHRAAQSRATNVV